MGVKEVYAFPAEKGFLFGVSGNTDSELVEDCRKGFFVLVRSPNMTQAIFGSLRRKYHERIGQGIVRFTVSKTEEFPNFADGCSKSSVALSNRLSEKLGFSRKKEKLSGQEAGRLFEQITLEFIKEGFQELQHLRPATWEYLAGQTEIYQFVQYRHLAQLNSLLQSHPELASVLGVDYMIKPDIVIVRRPVSDEEINQRRLLLEKTDPRTARLTPFRQTNQGDSPKCFLHASISCKWTIRSDRSQNTRTEAVNLIRNRKGPLPHIVAVTAEPLPTRIASLALGTGEMDCVYHIALPELQQTCHEIGLEDQLDMLETMIQGDRLRDISDLLLDLAV